MNEVMVHVDFAENYGCKMNTEIQAMHCGASKRQIALHNGVYRFGKSENSISFCSISDFLEHALPAIWANLEPVLNTIKQDPNIDTIHFFTDGPSSQHREKGNFQLFLQMKWLTMDLNMLHGITMKQAMQRCSRFGRCCPSKDLQIMAMAFVRHLILFAKSDERDKYRTL